MMLLIKTVRLSILKPDNENPSQLTAIIISDKNNTKLVY